MNKRGVTMKLTLIHASQEYRTQITDFLDEYTNSGERLVPSALSKKDYHNYDECCQFFNDRQYPTEAGHVPATLYFCLDEERNIVVGAIDIRHYLNEPLLAFGGHIGDGVRPSERRKGIATQMIGLALQKCKELNIDKVLMTCLKENIPSAKSIMNNGGILENEIEVEGKIYQRYWIDLIK